MPPTSKSKIPKLLTILYDKRNYVIYYKNLHQAIKLGFKITKIHRVLTFRQTNWLKKYIDLDTGLRKYSKNEFEKNIYKLINNAFFGKTIANIRKYKDVKLVTRWLGRYSANYYISKPNFYSCTIFENDIVIIGMNILNFKFNKSIFVGFQFSFQFFVEHIYECIKANINKFYTSDYPPTNVFKILLKNKKVVGLIKDENNGKIMTEIIGLMYAMKIKSDKSKIYIQEIEIRIKNLDVIKKAEGITKPALTNITFDYYYQCLFNSFSTDVSQHLIKSIKYEVVTIEQKK